MAQVGWNSMGSAMKKYRMPFFFFFYDSRASKLQYVIHGLSFYGQLWCTLNPRGSSILMWHYFHQSLTTLDLSK